MTIDAKTSIANYFAVLGIDVEKDVDLARGYFLISLANACFGGNTPVHIDVNNAKFVNFLKMFHVPFFSELDSFSDAQRVAATCLIGLFQKENLFENHRAFFDFFSPFLVDWERFSACFSEDHGLKAKMFAVLAILLAQDDSLRKPQDIYSQFDPIIDILFNQSDFTEEWLSAFNLKQEDFIACFNSIFSRPSLKLSVKNNGNINHAIKKYRSYYVPLERLLEDYYLIKTHSDSFEGVVNPWAYVHKGIRKTPVEVGVSVSETLFELAAYPLREERPTDVIRSLFYPKTVSDSDFECSFLLSEFIKIVKKNSNVLIVHPSPDLILKWNAHSDTIGVKSIYAVPNTIISELYQMEFPEKTFISFEQIKELNHLDYVLITPRNLPLDSMSCVLDSLSVCNQDAEILGLFPNILFDVDTCDIRKRILGNQLKLERMVLIASKVVASSPRKKVLMYLRKGSILEADATIPTWYLSAWANGDYYISKEHFSIPATEFLKGGLSIKSMMTKAIQRKKYGNELSKKDPRGAAEQYRFSSEITIQYTLSANRKNRFAGKAYYCSCKIPENSRRKRGERLTDFVEAGLRAKSEEEVVQKLEWIPFDDRVYPHIITDICTNHQDCLDNLSLKTIWFCLHPQLQENKKYNEKLCFSMFCEDKQELSILVPQYATVEDYIDTLDYLLAPESKTVQFQYWSQLDLIFKSAISNGFLRFNPISEQVHKLSSQATEEQREVRNALVKKTFSTVEEARMLEYITEETSTNYNDRLLRRYEKESIWLAGAIKLFTGLSTREVCALQWRDFVKIPHTNVYQFIITKYVDDKGTPLNYGANDEAKKIRKVPVLPVLSMLLLQRHQYLTDKEGHAPSKKEPIILRSENKKGLLFARPRYVTEKCQDLLKQARIPVQTLILPDAQGGKETDINRYYGDIFLSNFRYQANHTCGLTRGELNYMLGIELADTFSKHYCDFSADLIQYAVANKLQRWYSTLPTLSQIQSQERKSSPQNMIVVNPHSNENAAVDLIIETVSHHLTDVEIKIDCELGFACYVVCLKRRISNARKN